jgi:hypothetical protein
MNKDIKKAPDIKTGAFKAISITQSSSPSLSGEGAGG